jgi:hypothetical protein
VNIKRIGFGTWNIETMTVLIGLYIGDARYFGLIYIFNLDIFV